MKNLSFAYDSFPVFSGLTFNASGNLVLLEGPSGCGKTTLLKLLSGMLVGASGAAIRTPQPARLVLQEDGLFPWLTVQQNLACVSHSLPELDGPLAQFVKPLLAQRACNLSFGQRRIVELFRALRAPSPLMCLDEPLNFLDAGRREAVVFEIESRAALGSVFVMSSHHADDFPRWKGTIVRFDGTMPVRSVQLAKC